MVGVPGGAGPARWRPVAWAALVLALAAQLVGLYSPATPGPEGVPGLDKVGHLLAFAVPAALAWALRARWLVLLLVGHALVAELVQHALVPGRAAEVGDAVANLVGIGLGVLLAHVLVRRRHDVGMPSVVDLEGRG